MKPDSSLRSVPWERVAEHVEFSPRDTAEDLVFNDRMWLSNGYYHGNVLHRDLWSSKDGVTWDKILDKTPYDGYSELIVFKGEMWAIKGSVWRSCDGITWEQVLEKTPFGKRGYGECVLHQGAIWQLGSGRDVWKTADAKAWTCVNSSAPFGKRYASSVVVFEDKLWVMGGSTAGTNTPPEKGYKDKTTHNDVWCSADGVDWTCITLKAPWPPRQWAVAKVYRGRIWLIGGHDNVNSGNLGDVWHSVDGQNWERYASSTCFSGRHEPSAYVYRDSLWVVAGNSWPVKNDVWRLTLPTADTLPKE